MRRSSPQYVTVSPIPTTLEIHSDFIVCMVLVTPVTVGHPVYFRIDGETAAIATDGNYCVLGLGSQAMISVHEMPGAINLSLVSPGTGLVFVSTVEMV